MDACRDPTTRDLYIHNLRQLRELTSVFMLTIERNISKIPFGIRYISRQIFKSLKVICLILWLIKDIVSTIIGRGYYKSCC